MMLQNTPLFLMLSLLVNAYFISCTRYHRLLTSITLSAVAILYAMYSSGRVGGVDTPFYRVMFGNKEDCSRFEYGFSQLCSLDSTSGFSFLFFISSVLLMFFVYKASENLKVLCIALLILFPFYFVVVDLGYLRQSIATSIMYLFCFNQEKRYVRMIGYLLSPLFHIASITMIFFFELLYSEKKIKLPLVLSSLLIIIVWMYFLFKWIDSDLIGLLNKDFSILSIAQLLFFLTLNKIAAIQYRWKRRVAVFITLVCIAGYFGHLYRVYLFFVPIIAIGVAHYVVKKKMPIRLGWLVSLAIIGFAKLSSTLNEFEGSFDVPYSENLLFWFL
jgi:hypothetical protein